MVVSVAQMLVGAKESSACAMGGEENLVRGKAAWGWREIQTGAFDVGVDLEFVAGYLNGGALRGS